MIKNPLLHLPGRQKISSPEQLDQIVQVTSSQSWIILLGLIGIVVSASIWSIIGRIPILITGNGILLPAHGLREIHGPFSAVISQLYVRAGDKVIKGQIIATTRAAASLPNERTAKSLISPYDGVILELSVGEGSFLQLGGKVAIVAPLHEEIQVAAFFPKVGSEVVSGMEAQVSPIAIPKEIYGFLKGRVEKVSDLPLSRTALYEILKNHSLAENFSMEGAPYLITIKLQKSANFGHYLWSSTKGPERELKIGMLAQIKVIFEERRPIEFIIPSLKSFFARK